jgi:hypothetical protein
MRSDNNILSKFHEQPKLQVHCSLTVTSTSTYSTWQSGRTCGTYPQPATPAHPTIPMPTPLSCVPRAMVKPTGLTRSSEQAPVFPKGLGSMRRVGVPSPRESHSVLPMFLSSSRHCSRLLLSLATFRETQAALQALARKERSLF